MSQDKIISELQLANSQLQAENRALRERLKESGLIANMAREPLTSVATEQPDEILSRLLKFISRLPGAIYQYRLKPDNSTSIPFASDGMGKILGMPQELVTKDSISAFAKMHFEDYESVFSSIKRSAAELTPWNEEFRVIDDDGTIRWIAGSSVPEREADGSTLWHGYVLDITEKKRIELELKRVAETLEEAQAMAKIGSWSHEIKTGITRWSNQLFSIFGCDPRSAPLIRPHVYERFHPEDVPLLDSLFTEVKKSGQPYSLVRRFKIDANKYGFMRCEGKARRNESGEIVELFGTIQDVTEEIERENKLEAAREKAEAASLAKSAFLANMSHEIRTPLTAILGFTDLLKDDEISQSTTFDRVGTLETIEKACQHLLTIINDILDLSKIEAKAMTVQRSETMLPKLLHEVEQVVQHIAVGKGLQLEFVLRSSVPDRILSDATKIRQILLNLIGNAIKFTEGGIVKVEVEIHYEMGVTLLEIEVIDSGCGIHADQADQLFQPFSQVDNSHRRSHGGSGLGLHICRRLARLLGGDVWLVRTEMGHGSTFRVELPIETASGYQLVDDLNVRGHSSNVQTPEKVSVTLQGRILLAEDGIDNQKLIAFILRKAGAQVDVADDGCIALQMIWKANDEQAPYDLLVTDIQMPEMDGFELSQAIRQRGLQLPIVALTAHALEEDRQKCFDAGCNAYQAKPIDKTRLLLVCQQWMACPKEMS